jgi:hypothetical protein
VIGVGGVMYVWAIHVGDLRSGERWGWGPGVILCNPCTGDMILRASWMMLVGWVGKSF